MSKHTPGPWIAREPSDGDEWFFGHRLRNGIYGKQIVVSDSRDNEICVYSGNTDGEIANARLIAAAPDLLEACIEILAEMQVWETDQGTHPAATKARAAIVKATGGNNE